MRLIASDEQHDAIPGRLGSATARHASLLGWCARRVRRLAGQLDRGKHLNTHRSLYVPILNHAQTGSVRVSLPMELVKFPVLKARDSTVG